MRLAWMLSLMSLVAFSSHVDAADKTSPEFLRTKHAGLAEFDSKEGIDSLFPRVLRATQECWVGEVRPGTMGLMVSSASRTVVGELSPDRASAYIVVRARGFFGALQSNFLQIDLAKESAGTTVVVYHKNDVSGQREFFVEVEHWLKGDVSYCEAKPFIRKKSAGDEGATPY